jgi:hypothetical protein
MVTSRAPYRHRASTSTVPGEERDMQRPTRSFAIRAFIYAMLRPWLAVHNSHVKRS